MIDRSFDAVVQTISVVSEGYIELALISSTRRLE